jgi:hypothetical protein
MYRMAEALDRLTRFEAWLFTERRIRFYGLGVLVAYVIGLAVKSFWHIWLFQEDGKPSCTDFTTLWVTGIFAGSNDPTRMYDDLAWSAVWKTLTGLAGDGCPLAEGPYSYPQNLYPPLLLFFTYPLGFMPYAAAFATWTVATLLLYLVAIYLIVPRPIAILAALSPFPVFFNFFLGQNGFLLAGLIGLSLVLMERRPRLSRILLGLLTFKPQFGILFPFALLASRKWRVIGSAIATSVVADRHIRLCFWLSRMVLLHPHARKSWAKSGYAVGISVWFSLVGRSRPVNRVDNASGGCWCCDGGRVVVMGEAAPSDPESRWPLQRGRIGDAVCAWPRSMHPGGSRRLLGHGRPRTWVSARRPLDHALLLDRAVPGLSRFHKRMDSMLGPSCSRCAAYAETFQHRISTLLSRRH